MLDQLPDVQRQWIGPAWPQLFWAVGSLVVAFVVAFALGRARTRRAVRKYLGSPDRPPMRLRSVVRWWSLPLLAWLGVLLAGLLTGANLAIGWGALGFLAIPVLVLNLSLIFRSAAPGDAGDPEPDPPRGRYAWLTGDLLAVAVITVGGVGLMRSMAIPALLLVENASDVKPADATKISDAIVRVFIDLGDRTNRLKARLKYVIDGMGMEKFLVLVEDKLGHAFTRVPAEALLPRPDVDRNAHIGVHRQKQSGLNWIGVALPLGKVTCEQIRGLSKIAADLGDGDIRLTVWQNLLIPGVADDKVALATAAIEAIGLAIKTTEVRAGLIACTGRAGCKFGNADTKRTAAEIADWVDPRVTLDTPINIHLTGCHHSCAQHYISDIGMIGARVAVGDGDDTMDGFHVFTGGGFGPSADVGQEVYHDVKAEDATVVVEKLLKAYMANRTSPDETFLTFARRHDGDSLRKLAEQVSA